MRVTVLAPLAAAGLAAAAGAAPALASVDPSISVHPQRLALGSTATIQGQSWVVGAGCSARVRVRITGRADGQRWSAPIGTGHVKRHTAAFRLRFTPPQSKFPAGRATIVATQRCPDDQGGDLVRRTRITLVR